jgi:hypothetical protein
VVVGTFDRGAATLERGAWRAIDGIDPRVNDLALQGSRLWIATARGLFVREGRRLRRVAGLPSDDVHAVLPLRDGRVAVGTAKGAALLRGRKVVLLGAKQGLPIGGAVWALAEGGDGSLWLGSSRGLYRVPPRGRFTRLSMAGGHLPDDWITAIAIHEGTVYAGTYRRGVVRLTSGEAGWNGEPLGGGYVNFHGLRLEDGRLFAATMHGLKSRALDAAAWDPPRKTLGPDVTGFAGGWVATRRGLQRL